MFGKHANLSFLRTIGARGFVHNEAHLRKLDSRVRKGVIIGYNDDKLTYKISFHEIGQVTSPRNVAFIEVPAADISTTTGAEGQHDDDELVYEDVNIDIINDTNDCFFDGIINLESTVKTDSAPLSSTRRLLSSAAAAVVPMATVLAAEQLSTTGEAATAAGNTRKFQISSGLNQARALRQLAQATDFAVRQKAYTLMQ